VQLTGEVGTGKTTLCRCLLDQLPPEVDVALILNPQVTPAEFLATLCDELRIFYPAGATSLKPFVDALSRYLLNSHARGRRTVLIVDEAQSLPPSVLEQIRLLTNLETPTQKLLQIILIGQPELIRMLEGSRLRQLAQRITARYHLQPLCARDTAAYVTHRLRVSGGGDALFTPAALWAIHRWSGGIPRLINVICDRALLGAYAQDARRVGFRTVRRAAREVRGDRPHPVWAGRLGRIVAVAAVMAGVAAGAILAATRTWTPASPSLQGAAVPPPTAAAAAGAPVPATPAPSPPPLEDILAEIGRRGRQGNAFGSLVAKWGADPQPIVSASGDRCRASRSVGLACTSLVGDWNRIRRLDVPVLLEMFPPSAQGVFIPLVGLGETRATLEFDGRRLTYPRREIEARWRGAFLVLWKIPAPAPRRLAPGGEGPQVAWLRARLDAVEGHGARADASDVYDERLAERVRRFQRANSIAADGIVGEVTLLHLALAVREPGTPTLDGS
jgi:general secretion pathway protein A